MTTGGFTKKYAIPIAGIAILAALVSLSIGGAIPLSAQSPVAVTPNVVGDWGIVSWEGCGFHSVWDPIEQPRCGAPSGEGQPPMPFFRVTVQEGRAFAGTYPWEPGSKLTGAIGEDGTFLMQAWIGNNRMFISGRFFFTRNVLEMRGLANEFEDWRANTPSMNSSSFRFRKVN